MEEMKRNLWRWLTRNHAEGTIYLERIPDTEEAQAYAEKRRRYEPIDKD